MRLKLRYCWANGNRLRTCCDADAYDAQGAPCRFGPAQCAKTCRRFMVCGPCTRARRAMALSVRRAVPSEALAISHPPIMIVIRRETRSQCSRRRQIPFPRLLRPRGRRDCRPPKLEVLVGRILQQPLLGCCVRRIPWASSSSVIGLTPNRELRRPTCVP